MPAKNVYPAKSNSQSPIEEQLAEYRDCYNDPIKNVRIDQTKDPLITWKPVPYDPRFPNVDITKYCYVSFVDYYRCRKLRGPDYEPCDYFKNVYTGICPSFWIERWEEQRANGTFLANV